MTTLSLDEKAKILKNNLAFLDRMRILEPARNDQVGFDFQGLCRSYQDNPDHPDAASVARFGRIWIYDAALTIYALVKVGRLRQAGAMVGRVMQLALQERAKGFEGIWHFSYNTLGDSFIDPRGPLGANAWCLSAVYAYILASQDTSALEWANRMVREVLFGLQVVQPADPRYGLMRAGLYCADDVNRGEQMGYHVYEGDFNHRYEGVILEHSADVACTYRLCYRAVKRFAPQQGGFLNELVQRHDILMQGIRRCFWQKDHFVSAMDGKGRLYTGTDGEHSIAVDNNTWSAHLFLPYEPELVRSSIRYVEEKFRVRTPPAHVEGHETAEQPPPMEGLYYFPATFVDPFVWIPQEHRVKMENLLHPEAAYGFILLLNDLAAQTADPAEQERLRERAENLYADTIRLSRLYGPEGAPYASANVPTIFSTLQSVTTAASAAIATAVLSGVDGGDFVGAQPPPEFLVAGKPPRAA
ncbi:MAG: hypothetical protein COV76_06010 [Candidatus Omnitrophica bacterium CG11_big_fil_rev_8_21_14_0_20_64_10]|nr:MAG: hypothetical protein COV76_06010 [Candidatus Omnitrophica bacterium CG11_big_fil_rev_8_21_14_0_20_64_10]